MKRIKVPSLWTAFVVFVFFCFIISSLLLFLCGYLLFSLGLVTSPENNFIAPFISILLVSTAIASAIYLVLAKFIFAPITDFSHAMTDVAKGNFGIRLSYDGRVQELSEMSTHFNAMVHDLGNIETLRSDFVVTVSHEFKTPLAAIDGYAAILQKSDLQAAEIREYTEKIIESTKQLAKLSSNILMISNLENREIVTEKTAFRLDEQIRQSILMLEQLWENKKINLNIELDHAVYFGSEELLLQVWQNVIGNAVKFTPKNGEISISLHEHPGHFRIEVTDTGAGMSPEIQKHIFDKFYQGDPSGYTDGNGLGLSLVKRILVLCRGNIAVQSRLGLGTTIIIELPKESLH